MSNLLKNLIIALCITILAGVGYYFYSRGSQNDAPITQTTTSEATQQVEKILADTQKIASYKLDIDSAIFNDRRFISLQDRRTNLADVPTGRSNPFEPVR